MPGSPSHPVVQRALELAASNPHMPSLHVLDLAMDGQRSQHIDFEVDEPAAEFCDWLDPPSPFAALLRSAFGAHLDDVDVDAESPRWQEVIEAFADRYDLWR